MKRVLGLVFALSLSLITASAAWGATLGFGARAVGMGGAYTAIADDESAAYWNPAGITQTPHFRLAAGGGYHGDFKKLKNVFDKINDDQMPDREDLNGDYSLTVLAGLTTKHLGINVYSDTLLTTSEDVDQTIHANLTSINYGMVTLAGHFGGSKKLAVGLNAKAVYAGYGEVKLPPLPEDPSNVSAYEATTSYITAKGTAFDLGVLYQLNPKLNLGFMGRNLGAHLNSDTGTTTTYHLNVVNGSDLQWDSGQSSPYNHPIEIPQSYVLGLAYHPFKSTLLAADLESITNSTNDQTRLHVGLEQNALWNLLSLRLGCFTYKDDSTTQNSTGYTAGLGFNLWIINCSVACVRTDDKSYIATANIKF